MKTRSRFRWLHAKHITCKCAAVKVKFEMHWPGQNTLNLLIDMHMRASSRTRPHETDTLPVKTIIVIIVIQKASTLFLCFKLHHTYTPNGLYANCDHIIRSINKKIGVSCDFIRFEVALSFGASQKKKKIKIKSGIKGFAVVVFAVMPSHPFSGSRHTTLHPSKTSIYQYIFRYDSPKWNWRNFQIIIKYIWCVVFLFISGLNNVHAVAIQFCLFVMFVAVLFAIAIFINECEVARACAHVRACARQCIV